MTALERIHDMTGVEARAAVEEIRHDVDVLIARIDECWRRRAWIALGYASWQDLCVAEFPNRALPREERGAVVRELRSNGMSTRAIAAATGVAQSTVIADSQLNENRSPVVTGLDGKGRRPLKEHAEDIRALVTLGLNSQQIADELSLSASRVSQIAKVAGIALGKKSRQARAQRIERMRELAKEGATSPQIADELGVHLKVIATYSRDHGIDIPADATTRPNRHINSTRIVSTTIDTIDGIGAMFDHIDYSTLTTEDVDGWVSVLDDSIRSLTNLRKRLKELTQP